MDVRNFGHHILVLRILLVFCLVFLCNSQVVSGCRDEAKQRIVKCYNTLNFCDTVGCSVETHCSPSDWGCEGSINGTGVTTTSFYCDSEDKWNYNEDIEHVIDNICGESDHSIGESSSNNNSGFDFEDAADAAATVGAFMCMFKSDVDACLNAVRKARARSTDLEYSPEAQARKREIKRKPLPSPPPGYKRNHVNGALEWVPGLKHPDVPNIISAENDEYWKAEPGYRFKNPKISLEVEWRPGEAHPAWPNVISAKKEGYWKPSPGYSFIDSKKDFSVRWTKMLVHPDFPAVSATKEGYWWPKVGYYLETDVSYDLPAFGGFWEVSGVGDSAFAYSKNHMSYGNGYPANMLSKIVWKQGVTHPGYPNMYFVGFNPKPVLVASSEPGKWEGDRCSEYLGSDFCISDLPIKKCLLYGAKSSKAQLKKVYDEGCLRRQANKYIMLLPASPTADLLSGRKIKDK